MSDSGAPASTRAAETASVRGVAFGWAKVAVSMTMPAMSSAAIAPSPSSSGAPSRAASSVDHLAGRGASGLDPVGVAARVVRRVMVDDDPRQPLEQLRDAGPRPRRSDRACRSRTRRAGRSRSPGPGRSAPARRRAGSRRAAGPDRRRPPWRAPPPRSTRRQIAERRAERVGVGVLVADRQHAPRARVSRSTTASGTALEPGREVDHRRRLPGTAPVSSRDPGRTSAGWRLRGRVGAAAARRPRGGSAERPR